MSDAIDGMPVDRVLRKAVHDVFSHIAARPDDEHPLPVGRHLAEGVGYPAELLDSLPAEAVEAFAGVSWIWGFAEIPPGAVLLDLGCGSGLDSLIAARSARRVIAVDFALPMLDRARRSAAEAGAGNIEFREGDAEAIPLHDGEATSAVVNGIFNLNPARDHIFSELARVLRPGSRAFVAEIILKDGAPAPDADDDWFS